MAGGVLNGLIEVEPEVGFGTGSKAGFTLGGVAFCGQREQPLEDERIPDLAGLHHSIDVMAVAENGLCDRQIERGVVADEGHIGVGWKKGRTISRVR